MGVIVPVNSERRAMKSFGCMTVGTVGIMFFAHKFTPVIILMTICAALVLKRIGEFGFMTGFAVQVAVFILQFESGTVMIKTRQALDDTERSYGMALCALLSELVLMHICMAIRTGGKGYTCKLLKGLFIGLIDWMALRACHFFVFAFQFVFCPVMIKFRCRLKSLEIMTLHTVGRKRFLMRVGMARKAIGS